MINLIEIGTVIRKKRLSLNLTADSVANKVDITRSTLWKIETGKGNYSINALLAVLNVLSINLKLIGENKNSFDRKRATRINTARDKKINRFIVFCVEQYCAFTNQSGLSVYTNMYEKGIIKYLEDDYVDLHGMSFEYINELIDSLLRK